MMDSALRLHRYLFAQHIKHQALLGPDPGIRLNYRFGRFMKSYLRAIPWHDDLYYLQGQGYWVLANWRLFTQTNNPLYREAAIGCSAHMLTEQRESGEWIYPNREWKGRVATAEGTWAALGLIESYRQTADPVFLTGAERWNSYLNEHIKYQREGQQWAVNYFAGREGARVPNNSAFVLRFLIELAEVAGDQAYAEPCEGLLTFLRDVQKTSGEFPYAVSGTTSAYERPHFQCYQYNAFMCLDLVRYYEVSRDASSLPLIAGVLEFLRSGVAQDGHALYECGNTERAVVYHTAVVGTAFVKGSELQLGDFSNVADRLFQYVLHLQRKNGSFPYSHGDYRVLSDQRSYPRYLAMILNHLLMYAAAREEIPCESV